MSVVDPELRRREHDWLVSELAKNGIRVAQIEDLRDAANQTAESAALLLRLLPRVSEAIVAHAIVIAIGRHRCTRAVVASLIEYWHRLGSISWEEYIYLHNHEAISKPLKARAACKSHAGSR
jgi:arginine deiminase